MRAWASYRGGDLRIGDRRALACASSDEVGFELGDDSEDAEEEFADGVVGVIEAAPEAESRALSGKRVSAMSRASSTDRARRSSLLTTSVSPARHSTLLRRAPRSATRIAVARVGFAKASSPAGQGKQLLTTAGHRWGENHMTTNSTIEFELWSRQSWTNFDVVGEQYRLDEIRALFPATLGPSDREIVGTASLVRDPTNPHDPNAVKVVMNGRHLGFLPKDAARSYSPVIAALNAAGFTAVTSCRIYGYETRDYQGVDRRGRDIWAMVFEAQARIALDEPHLLVPVNLPPSQAYRMIPRGNSLQVKEEEKHLDVLAPLVGQHGEAWVYARLAAITVASGRSERELVELRINDEPIGVLTPAMSQHYLPIVRHLESNGEQAVAQVLLKGNDLKVEAVLYAAKAHELGPAWLSSTAPIPGVPRHSEPASTAVSPVHVLSKATPSAPTAPVATTPAPALTVAEAGPVSIPPKPSRIVFNPAPGWPAAPGGFEPPPGWQPIPDWPAAPDGWPFWVAR